jgi:hypothetical protein
MVDDGTASVQTEGGRRRWLRTPGMPDAKLDGLAGLRRARIRAHADIPPRAWTSTTTTSSSPCSASRRPGTRPPDDVATVDRSGATKISVFRGALRNRCRRTGRETPVISWATAFQLRQRLKASLWALPLVEGRRRDCGRAVGSRAGVQGRPAGRVALLRRHGEQRARRDHRPAWSRRDRHRARRPAGDRNTVASLHAAVVPRLTVSDAAPGGREPGSASTARAAGAVTRPARGRSIRQPRSSRTPAARPSDEVCSMR